jgi:hypothetical protein
MAINIRKAIQAVYTVGIVSRTAGPALPRPVNQALLLPRRSNDEPGIELVALSLAGTSSKAAESVRFNGGRNGLQALVVVAFLCTIQQLILADCERMPRVRSNGDPLIVRLLQEGIQRSHTFRHLVERINASDGIVYVERGKCGHGVRACLELTVRVAGPNRVLRIVADSHRDHERLLAAIGHELQHCIEALSDPHVADFPTMYYFFERIGSTGEQRFETRAAIDAGRAVSDELRANIH